MTRFLVVAATSAAALVWSGVAFGSGSAAAQGHAGTAGNVQNALAQSGSGALPFTGLNIVLLVAAGILLLSMGVTIRRLSRARA
jgi:hypothetical protein